MIRLMRSGLKQNHESNVRVQKLEPSETDVAGMFRFGGRIYFTDDRPGKWQKLPCR